MWPWNLSSTGFRCEKCSFDHEKVEKGVFMCSKWGKTGCNGDMMGMHHQKYDISVSESGAYTPNLSSKNGKTMISHQIWGDHGGPKFQTNPKIRGLNSATVSGVCTGKPSSASFSACRLNSSFRQAHHLGLRKLMWMVSKISTRKYYLKKKNISFHIHKTHKT